MSVLYSVTVTDETSVAELLAIENIIKSIRLDKIRVEEKAAKELEMLYNRVAYEVTVRFILFCLFND